MEFDQRVPVRIDRLIENGQLRPHRRLRCSFPIIIKGCNILGQHYDELALVEDIGRRGLCFRTNQALIPGSICTLYKTEDDLDPIATCEIVWARPWDIGIKKVGAQLVGDNLSWVRFLVRDIVVLPTSRTSPNKSLIH
ncbi:MAG: hypothetical protein AB1489_31110 [Acidobacteriota bacterium]